MKPPDREELGPKFLRFTAQQVGMMKNQYSINTHVVRNALELQKCI